MPGRRGTVLAAFPERFRMLRPVRDSPVPGFAAFGRDVSVSDAVIAVPGGLAGRGSAVRA